jgi:cytoskeleton protein RodZ
VPAAAPEHGAHVLKLSLSEASWVEVSSADGAKLEYGLLPAGSVRTYRSDSPVEVRLGNCSGAQVESDGTLRDLTPFRHANVAHFRLFSADDPISHID